MATILDLLMALNRGDLPGVPNPAKPLPVPLAPVPNLGPLSDETSAAFGALNPEPVPPRFIPPAAPDQNFINQYPGPAPTAPAPLSRAQRIFNAIGGFGAGVQGQGAQFLDQLREPQREYQRQVERYQGRRAQGIELEERRTEREADRANRANEMLYESEYKKWLSKNKDRSDEAKLRMAQALTLERDARRARLDADRDIQRRQATNEKQRNDIAADLIKSPNFAPQRIANEIADTLVYGKQMSPATEKWRSLRAQKLERQLANIGGGAGSSKNEVELIDANGQSLGRMPYSQIKFGQYGEVKGFPEGTQVRFSQAQAPTQSAPAPSAAALTSFPEFGGGLMSAKTIKMSEVRRNAARAKIKVAEAVQQFKDAGYSIQD